MIGKILVLGNHPLAEDLIKQYKKRHCVVDFCKEVTTQDICINNYDELCLLTSISDDYKEEVDNKMISLIPQLAEKYDMEQHQGKKLLCHLLVQSQKTLRMLQTTDFCEAIRQKIDVYPFTMDEVWSRSVVLDYEPITMQSEKHVHLVVFGMDEMARMVAIQAAHIAHYPNYVKNHLLRTRITMIASQAEDKCRSFIKEYQHLFDNSYYRIVNFSEEKAVVVFHKPMYEGLREDFVDVEWEFVEAEVWNAELHGKLKLWAKDERQLLTIVIANQEGNKNVNDALHLPDVLYQRSVPIYVYSQKEVRLNNYPNLHVIGMTDRGYNVELPLVRMAKNVNYIYDRCFEDNDKNWSGQMFYTVEIDREERDRSWAKLKNVKRTSSVFNAMTIPTKMRSVGMEENDWSHFYDITQQDIEMLAQVEHNRWSVEELILGFRPTTDKEDNIIAADVKTQKDSFKARGIHYDLRAYNELRPDGTGKPVQVYDLCLSSCLPLIAKSFAEEEGGDT